ncbi:class I SAM-dependent rRNA methyltransferase [bacterium]|nr:class I SAM-dependent rRNA methyltransferase [bacterium]
MSTSKKVWRLKKGSDRRFRAGHPWVYSNELQSSPKGIEPGALVELYDVGGKFLAQGFGNPSSLIAFRTLTTQSESDPTTLEAITQKLDAAFELRKRLGYLNKRNSHRLCFGEADGLPGLIIDHYLGDAGNACVVQAHTAGAQKILGVVTEALKKVCGPDAAVIFRNDAGFRKLEGLEEEEPQVVSNPKKLSLEKFQLRSGGLTFEADLVNGQKTGFFLDQAANIELALQRFETLVRASGLKKIKVLDLCSYVGQWSAHLAQMAKRLEVALEVTAIDASGPALSFAAKNIERNGSGPKIETLKGDVFDELAKLEEASFDLVISDPPAFIKGRKDLPTGSHAYLQLNTQATRVLKRQGGGIVACSCSGLLDEETFLQILSKAARRSTREIHWVGRGTQAPDHPVLAQFPEGRYLKAFIGFTH